MTKEAARGLGPLKEDLAPEVRDLTVFLRSQFMRLGMHLRAYAKAVDRNSGDISRYLQGLEIPGPDFVERLVSDANAVIPVGARKPESDHYEQGQELLKKAIRQRDARRTEVETLRQQLSEAEHRLNTATRREQDLQQRLSNAEAESKELMERLRLFEQQREWRSGPLAIEQGHEKKELDRRRSAVAAEVATLQEELARERGARQMAEARRDELQKRLDDAYLELENAGVFMARSRVRRGSGPADLISNLSVVYAGPAYFGIVFGLFSYGWGPARWLTLSGLMVSICYAYREQRDDPNYPAFILAPFAWTIVKILALFLAGFLLGHFGGSLVE